MRVRLVRQGDIIIVKAKRRLTIEQAGQIKAAIEKVGLQALVFDETYDLAVKRHWFGRRP